jgi:hypothetical protein
MRCLLQAAADEFAGLVKDFAPDAEAVWGDQGLETVFASPVDAVAIVLPAQVQVGRPSWSLHFTLLLKM